MLSRPARSSPAAGIMGDSGTWRSLVSALVWGTRGRRFKSGRPDELPSAAQIRCDLSTRSSCRGIVESPHAESTGIDSPPDGGRLATIPNLLSALRLASVPVFIGLFVSGHEEAAVILYAVGAWTDFFDGYIARHTGQVTEIGKLLDPLA